MNEVRNIKQKLDAWGIKYSWLAKKLQVSNTMLSMWMSGERDMPDYKLKEAKQYIEKLPMPE